MKITSTQEHEHVANGGAKCPACGSDLISTPMLETLRKKSDVEAVEGQRCRKCKLTWTDSYTLAGIVEAEHGPAPDKDEIVTELVAACLEMVVEMKGRTDGSPQYWRAHNRGLVALDSAEAAGITIYEESQAKGEL